MAVSHRRMVEVVAAIAALVVGIVVLGYSSRMKVGIRAGAATTRTNPVAGIIPFAIAANILLQNQAY